MWESASESWFLLPSAFFKKVKSKKQNYLQKREGNGQKWEVVEAQGRLGHGNTLKSGLQDRLSNIVLDYLE